MSVPKALSAKFKGSFAYDTVKDRLPVILTKTIDAVHREINNYQEKYGKSGAEDIKTVIGKLSKLRNELMTDKPLMKVHDDLGDAEVWNEALDILRQHEDNPPSYFKSPWLFVECAMYRSITSAIQSSDYMKGFDPYWNQKNESLENALPGAIIMAEFLDKYAVEGTKSADNSLLNHFETFLKASLWSNKFDLSLSCGVNQDPESHDPVQVAEKLQHFLLADESKEIFECLINARKKESDVIRVDIVLDNAGFEFVSDLFLAEFLLKSKLADKVHYHVKNIPWFVSDVTAQDIEKTIEKLSGHDSILSSYGKLWRSRFDNGTFVVVPKDMCRYWTFPFPYYKMQSKDPKLFKYLQDTSFIIFKGDLNFRKLVADLAWDSDTKFGTALQGFCPAPLCSLRTLKADVVVGLTPETASDAESSDEDWMVSGKYAVVLFHAA